jgi:hypothetical protein
MEIRRSAPLASSTSVKCPLFSGVFLRIGRVRAARELWQCPPTESRSCRPAREPCARVAAFALATFYDQVVTLWNQIWHCVVSE